MPGRAEVAQAPTEVGRFLPRALCSRSRHGRLTGQRAEDNSAIRKFTRNRKIYFNEESALKIVVLAIREASRKWTSPIFDGKPALNHFAILREGRLPK